MPRFYCPTPLTTGDLLDLPASAARHVQVLRLQPGDAITLFSGGPDVPSSNGGEYEATVTQMGRSHVQVQVGAHTAVEREAALQVHLAVGMPANERMDWLVEKASELGVASIQPLMSERSVLRLTGERADKKQAHWQSVAVAACEQCGGNRVPRVHAVLTLAQWLKTQDPPDAAQQQRLLLSLRPESLGLREAAQPTAPAITFLSGPEGGLSAAEEEAALAQGFAPVTLGPRVLRSETAALAALAALLI
jgi:16S rRNA (uracil1498-N3)-methyltransferase